MANELIHASVGTVCTQAEFEAVGLHVCNSQATGDLLYASSASQLSRLAIGAVDTVLTCNGSVPSWSATPILNTAIAKGTWTASGTWTIPAVTLSGHITGANYNIGTITTLTFLPDNSSIIASASNGGLRFSGSSAMGPGGLIFLYGGTHAAKPGYIEFYTNNAAASGSVTRLTFGNGTTAVATWAAVTQVGFVLGGNMTVTGYALDAGTGSAQINTTGANFGLVILSTQDGATGARLVLQTNSASPAVDDLIAESAFVGNTSTAASVAYGSHRCYLTNVTNGAETAKFHWSLRNGAAENLAMALTGAGVLSVDLSGSGGAAQVDLFDNYDDALVLKQGIQQNNRELLADIGVLERKNTGSGYMMKLQPMVRLLAGGIYQSRAMIDQMQTKIELLESKLKLLGAG